MYINKAYILTKMDESDLARLSSGGPSSVDENVVNSLIADAEIEVNTKLASRYVLPLESVPDEIKLITFRVFQFLLETRRQGAKANESTHDKYKQAIRNLELRVSGSNDFTNEIAYVKANPNASLLFAGNNNQKKYTKEFLDKY